VKEKYEKPELVEFDDLLNLTGGQAASQITPGPGGTIN
jgi:hypothetical protein